MKSKRVVIISDLHCGHEVGLTHPDFNPRSETEAGKLLTRERTKYWNFYAEVIKSLLPIDLLIVNGDAIDGKGEASEGVELIAPKLSDQADMATAAIEECRAGAIWMAYGTAYHTGKGDDWEEIIAQKVKAIKIGGEDYLSLNGLTFSCKHHIGRSESPMGRLTALARAHIWNVLWNEWQEYPKADVIIRSHVHYFGHCGGYGWLAITTPALQGYGSHLGQRRMEGTVDFGLVSFDVVSKDDYSWTPHILKANSWRQQLITV